MKKLFVLLLVVSTGIFVANKVMAQAAGTYSCQVCMFESHYFSEGSVVGQVKPLGESGQLYPYTCTSGSWIHSDNFPCDKFFIAAPRSINEWEIKYAMDCRSCLYNDNVYSEGSIICMPKKDNKVQSKIYPYSCVKGKWTSIDGSNSCN
ncbi:MAG: hypothetical protein WCM76_07900 [Bacteroidota bacterium]